MVVMIFMIIMVIRTDRTLRTQGQTDLTFKLDFPGNLCRAAFAILAMFSLKFSWLFLKGPGQDSPLSESTLVTLFWLDILS